MDRIFRLLDIPGSEETFPFSIGVAHLDRKSFEEHSHDYSEIVIILRGKGIHITNAGEFPIRAGDVYIIHPRLSHGFRECVDLFMYNLSYREKFPEQLNLGGFPGFQALFNLEPLYRKQHKFTRGLHLKPEQRLSVERQCRILKEELSRKKPGFRTVYEARFRALSVELCRFYEENTEIKTGEQEEEPADLIKLGKALAVLEQNYTSNITIEKLALLSGYSLNHFSRLCKRVYGMPPRQYVVQQRLSLAARLLREGEFTVTEISCRCGYDDPNYFSRLFRKKMGMSPREYREG